ncbi:BrnA antitoxin family protein [Candidatus Poribacteria bacterium]|nr:BrnA antitoxin family protein [Candidatus Poribacteria bacterium]
MQPLEKHLREIDAIPDKEIDTSDIPELDEDFWQNAKMIVPENYLRVDPETLEWFKVHARDYEADINAILRGYVQSHQTAG